MTGKAWPVIMPLLLAGCLATGGNMVDRPSASEQLLGVCRTYYSQLPVLAESIRLDAKRSYDDRLFTADMIDVIAKADDTLDDLCPPPIGFVPTLTTVDAARTAVLAIAAPLEAKP